MRPPSSFPITHKHLKFAKDKRAATAGSLQFQRPHWLLESWEGRGDVWGGGVLGDTEQRVTGGVGGRRKGKFKTLQLWKEKRRREP